MKKLFAALLILALLLCGMAALAEDTAPDEAEMDQTLLGEWLEAETQFTQMTIEKNPEAGWDVEIAAPLAHGAYVFKTTIRYDADQQCFTYDKGKFWDVPITEEKNPELGEAKIAGTIGTFTWDDRNQILTWMDDSQPERKVLFERVSGDYTYYAQIEEYVGAWAVSDYILEIVHMDDDDALLNCVVTQYAGDHQGVRWIYDACSYDDVGNALSSFEIGRKLTCVFDDDNELVSNELIYDDGAAAFRLNDDGTLTWTDFKETPGKNEVVFERADADENKFTGNTTLAVVITNGRFDKAQLCKIAGMAHDGYARSINPVHTTADGDSIYATSVGDVQADQDLVGALAAEVVSEAILRAVESAESAYGLLSARDLR